MMSQYSRYHDKIDTNMHVLTVGFLLSFFLATVRITTQNREIGQISGLAEQNHPLLYISSD